MKKVLIITYYWPPAGGPGVQRALKFAKYLPEFGWQPIILTVKNGEFPAYDESLFSDIPDECKVYKTPAIEPFSLYKKFTGMDANEAIPVATLTEKKTNWKKKLAHWIRLNLFIPDAKIGWIPYAVKAGKHIIRNEKPDIIFSSSPPPTVHLIARSLARWSRIKWIADFRDPWTKIHYYHNKRTRLSQLADNNLEHKTISSCSRTTCVSPKFSRLLTLNRNKKIEIIPNGYDKNELSSKWKQTDFFYIIHVGGINRSRYYQSFFGSLQNLIKTNKLNSDRVQLLFIGKVDSSIQNSIKQEFSELNKVKFIGYIPHIKAIDYMYRATVLLLFLENTKNYEGHVPGKLFEYVATGNYILGIGPKTGDAAYILEETGIGKMFEKTDQMGIEKAIEIQYENWIKGIRPNINTEIIKKYSRKALTQQLATIFHSLA